MDPETAAVESRRLLLQTALADVRDGRGAGTLVGARIDGDRATMLLEPIAQARASIEWIAINGDRVDAVLTAGEVQWRAVFGSADGETIDWLDVYRRPSHFAGVTGGRAIAVNGPSGAGKTTLLRAMQDVAAVPFVVFDEPEHIGTVQPGYLIWRDRAPALHRGYLEAIATLARCGNHVALSAAGHPQQELIEVFDDVPLLSVGLICDPEVLHRREHRTGRWGGIAADSFGIHDGWTYNVEFDTTAEPDPLHMAEEVLEQLKLRAEHEAPIGQRS